MEKRFVLIFFICSCTVTTVALQDNMKFAPGEWDILLIAGKNKSGPCLPRKVITTFINLINEYFSPDMLDGMTGIYLPSHLYFSDLTRQEVCNLANFLEIIYAATHGNEDPEVIRNNLYILYKKISGDDFYHHILNALEKVHLEYPDQKAITVDCINELMTCRSQHPKPNIKKQITQVLLTIVGIQTSWYITGYMGYNNGYFEKLIIAAVVLLTVYFFTHANDFLVQFERPLDNLKRHKRIS